ESAMWELRYGLAQFMVVDAAARQKIIADGPKWYQVIDENMKLYRQIARTPEEMQTLNEWEDVFRKYAEARPRWFELYGSGKTEEAAAWRAKTTFPYGGATVQGFKKLVILQQARREAVVAKGKATHWLILGIFTLAALVNILVIFIATGIT